MGGRQCYRITDTANGYSDSCIPLRPERRGRTPHTLRYSPVSAFGALLDLLREGDTACSAGGELVTNFCFNRHTGSRLAAAVLVLVLVSLG